MISAMEQSIVAPEENQEDRKLDTTLRPKRLSEYVGQSKVKENLKVFITASQKRKEPLEHVLIHGGPGLGKTTLATIIAHETSVPIRMTSGPAMERAGDLAAILTNLQEGEILFIDEIHRLNRTIEEMLYPAMEEFALDLIVGKGPGAKTLRLDLPRFTLIGATTRIGRLSSPLRDRFGVNFHLDFYEEGDIEKIIVRSAKILAIGIDSDAVKVIAKRSRRTPRVANRLLKRVRDFAQVKGDGKVTLEFANEALSMLDIDELGLDATDRKILHSIIEKFEGGPVGIEAIAAATSEDRETIEDVYEPYLLQVGMLDRTPKGRVVTKRAYDHLKMARPGVLL
jgi:Holliday junction DNA helicase RuvB